MENKDIDKAAREYATFAVTDAETGEPVSYVNGCCEQAFKAGSDYMAVEMKRDILYYQQDIIDGLKREGIARKTISNKQVEIDELIKALEEIICVWNMPVSDRCKPYAKTMNDAIHKATQLLEKYGKK